MCGAPPLVPCRPLVDGASRRTAASLDCHPEPREPSGARERERGICSSKKGLDQLRRVGGSRAERLYAFFELFVPAGVSVPMTLAST
jgi:hypothetical protein